MEHTADKTHVIQTVAMQEGGGNFFTWMVRTWNLFHHYSLNVCVQLALAVSVHQYADFLIPLPSLREQDEPLLFLLNVKTMRMKSL